MGGTLELLDVPRGAAFRLRIPAPPALAIVSDTDRSMTILIAEDDPLTLDQASSAEAR